MNKKHVVFTIRETVVTPVLKHPQAVDIKVIRNYQLNENGKQALALARENK